LKGEFVMSVLIDFSIFPLDKGESMSAYVARAMKIIKDSGLPHKFGPMGTSVEGEWDQIIGLLGECFENFRKDCKRISMNVKVDYRKGPGGRIEGKMMSVKKRLIKTS
jgi:uncharacterized protein (TIGR00106 family)